MDLSGLMVCGSVNLRLDAFIAADRGRLPLPARRKPVPGSARAPARRQPCSPEGRKAKGRRHGGSTSAAAAAAAGAPQPERVGSGPVFALA